MSRDCPFLEWSSSAGMFGGYICLKTQDRILTGSALYDNYCHDYESSYSKCPHFGSGSSSSGGCYLTSACVEEMHLPDDCHELTVLRTFRDGWLAQQPGGKEEIEEYYRIAPQIVTRIHASADCNAVLKDIYGQLVLPCVHFIEQGDNEQAHALYRESTIALKRKYLEG